MLTLYMKTKDYRKNVTSVSLFVQMGTKFVISLTNNQIILNNKYIDNTSSK